MMADRSRDVMTLIAGSLLASSAFAQGGPPPVPPLGSPQVPLGNPITESKRVLGKILFWDEQLSSDNTVSCGTCHTPSRGGGDARRNPNNGPDNILGNPDDIFASPGVVKSDALGNYLRSADFNFQKQVTGRSSPSAFTGSYMIDNFWDGRARPNFIDPQTGQTVLNANGALESQAVGPPLSDVEMAHGARDWNAIATKLTDAKPLGLATNIPTDVANRLASNPNYPQLFRDAFGNSGEAITAARIALAIATYERTLVPDQTPWDAFNAGNTAALTPNQVQGLNVFASPGARCSACHTPPLFSNRGFHNLGLRPAAEDIGRQAVTNNAADIGKFKTPSLRNVGLRNSFFHNGARTTLTQVLQFYANAPGTVRFVQNIDPLILGINLPPQQAGPLQDFLTNGLTDPRVANAQFPFDKPTMWDERPADKPSIIGGGVTGINGIPQIIAVDPPLVNGKDFRLGVFNARNGATASVMIATTPPVGGQITGGTVLNATGTVSTDGVHTLHWIIPASFTGQQVWAQWSIGDANAVGGIAKSSIATFTPFCQRGGCASTCLADLGKQGGLSGGDGSLDNNDFVVFVSMFFSQNGDADLGKQGGIPGRDGFLDNNDFVVFIGKFFEGC